MNDLFIITSEDKNIPDNKLFGYAYTEDSIIFGDKGLKQYLVNRTFNAQALNEGKFILLYSENGNHILKTDSMGQDLLFYYKEEKFWAISNSFYKICLAAKHNNVDRNIHLPALLPYFINRGTGLTKFPLSFNTPMEEIKLLPIGHKIVINKKTSKINVLRSRANDTFKNELYEEEYIEALINYVNKWCSRLISLTSYPFSEIVADVSGGYDSRMALGLILASGIDQNKIIFKSSEFKKDDYEIAKRLSKHCEVELNKPLKIKRTIEAKDAYEMWKYASIGGYLPIYYPMHLNPPNSIHIKGDGGEIIRRLYSQKQINNEAKIKKYFDKADYYFKVKKEFNDALNYLGDEIDNTFIMTEQFINFGQRYHFGRYWYRSLTRTPISPLICPLLREIAMRVPSGMIDSKQVVCDILLLLKPSLAKIPFDKIEKSFPTAILHNSPFWKQKDFLKKHNNFKLLDVYCDNMTSQTIENEKKPLDPISDKRFLELFLDDFLIYKEKARSLGIFNSDYINASDEEIRTCKKISHDLRKTTHIFYAGSVVDMVED